jgi:hypothetical protein
MLLIVDTERSMTTLFGLRAAATACAISLAFTGGGAAFAHPTDFARSDKEQQKRVDQISKLDAAHFAQTVKIDADDLEAVATITSEAGISEKTSFSARVRSNNFVRALISRASGQTQWQIYQSVTYSGAWRRFTSVNLKIGDQLVTRPLDIIARDVITCEYGLCVYTEAMGIPLTEDEIATLKAQARSSPTAVLTFRLKAQGGIDWDDDIPLAEIEGVARAVANYRAKARF